MAGETVVPGGFTVDDFARDLAAGTLTCPAGITRHITRRGNVTFGVACTGCALRDRCTTSARGRKIVVGEHELLQRAPRARAEGDEFQNTYRTLRSMVREPSHG